MNWKAGLCRTPLSKWASLPVEFYISLSPVNVPSPVSSPSLYRQASNGVKFTRVDPEAQINWTSVPIFLWIKKTYSKWCDNQKGNGCGDSWFFASFDQYLPMKYKWYFSDHVLLPKCLGKPRVPTQQMCPVGQFLKWNPTLKLNQALAIWEDLMWKFKQKRVTIESLLLSAA